MESLAVNEFKKLQPLICSLPENIIKHKIEIIKKEIIYFYAAFLTGGFNSMKATTAPTAARAATTRKKGL